MNYIFELLFFGVQVAIADQYAILLNRKQKVSHWIGFLITILLIWAAWYIRNENYNLLVALILVRFISFTPVLNYIRRPPKYFFYVRTDDKNGSWVDRLFIQVEALYSFFYCVAVIILIVLQTFL